MSEATPTIDARPVDELLQQHLEHVPPHIAKELDELSLRLSHVDMFEETTKTTASGHEYSETDFDKNITDSAHGSSPLQAEAIEAAHAGKERVSHLLTGSAALLGQAHAKLEAEGSSFVQPESETEAQRDQRQAQEKESVYETAYALAIEKAAALREAGDSQSATDLLESVIILRDVKEKDNPIPDRKVFRDVVRAGLGNELLAACQESQNMYVDTSHHTLGKNIHNATILLSCATGKTIDYGFEITDKPFTIDQQSMVLDENLIDLLAVISLPDSDMQLGAIPADSYIVALQEIKKISYLPAQEQHAALNMMYQVIESTGYSESMLNLCKTTDHPLEIAAAMKLFGIESWEAKDIFSAREKDEHGRSKEMGKVNIEELKQFEQYMTTSPEDAQLIVQALVKEIEERKLFSGFNPEAASEALATLRSHDLLDNELIMHVALGGSAEQINTFVAALEQIGADVSLQPRELLDMLSFRDRGSILKSISNADLTPEQISLKILDKLTSKQIDTFFTERFSAVEYPLTADSLPELQLADFPFLEKRLRDTGLSEELMKDIFKSWSTYDAVGNYVYSQFGSIYPTEKGPELRHIIMDQTKAFMTQVEAIEKSFDVLGPENTAEIIQEFGIYNFSRHKTEDLGNQLERWKSGEKVQSVVVEARADWNSFAGRLPKFEDEVGDGVFYFEANSGTETARVAVTVGQRERSLGREPDVSRFIIHAHGNSETMVMGVNDERINISGYLEAMEKAQKIEKTESNDFKRHLGPNFQVILQACSTGGEIAGSKNIAKMISETHGTTVQASDVEIYGVNIQSDGSVKFSSYDGDGKPVIYQPK